MGLTCSCVILTVVFGDSSRFTPAATALVLSPLQMPAAKISSQTMPRVLSCEHLIQKQRGAHLLELGGWQPGRTSRRCP